VNFMDYLLYLDLAQAQHHRARTPELINQEDHDVYVLFSEDSSKISLLGLSELLAHDALYLDLVSF